MLKNGNDQRHLDSGSVSVESGLAVKTVNAMPGGAREIAALVAMPRLLTALGFAVGERTHRCSCILHGGSNPTAFAWTDAGLWKCHSCGAGGDKIALVRAVRQCRFREAVEVLAALAGVEYLNAPLAPEAQARLHREK